jgi:hypothetical protein
MNATVPKYITDKNGKKISVILPIKVYKQLLEELEDLEDVVLYDEAKASEQEYLTAEEVFNRIEANRKKNDIQSHS